MPKIGPEGGQSPHYSVKRVEVIAKATDMIARIYTLAPGDEIPWHRHSAVPDQFIGVAGQVRVERRDTGDVILEPGDSTVVPPQTPHRVTNAGSDGDAQFFLFQGVGKYDFVPVDP